MSQRLIRNFLEDQLGYSRVKQLVDGELPLDRTIIHMFADTLFQELGINRLSSKNLPQVPKIHSLRYLETVVRAKKVHSDGTPLGSAIPESVLAGKTWLIDTQDIYWGRTSGYIAIAFDKIAQTYFPHSVRSITNRSMNGEELDAEFELRMWDEDVHIVVSGMHKPDGRRARNVQMAFNLDRGVSSMNRWTATYNQIAWSLPQAVMHFSRKHLEPATQKMIDLSLVDRLGEDDQGVLSTLAHMSLPAYDPNITGSQLGAVTLHSMRGPVICLGKRMVDKTGEDGILKRVEVPGEMVAYSPKESKLIILQHKD